MATPVVTDYVLMKALQDARRKGAPSDPYGIATAIRSMGGDYDAMNKSIIGSNQAQLSNAETEAKLNAGFFPAQVAEKMAGFAKQTYDDTQHVTRAQAIEEAHKTAAQRGPAGSPEYNKAMNEILTQQGPYKAAADTVKGAREATKTLQERGLAQNFVKTAVLNKLAMNIAQDYYNQKTANQSMSAEQKNIVAEEARQHAKNLMLKKEVKINMSPDGEITAIDNDGTTVPIDPQVTAAALSIMGDDTAMKTIGVLSKDAQANLKQILADRKEANQARAAQMRIEATKGKMPNLYDAKEVYAHLRTMEGKYLDALLKGEVKPEALKAAEERITTFKADHPDVFGVPAANKPYDPNSMVTKIIGSASSPNPYGSPAAPNLGLIPDDLQQPATEPPDLLGIPPIFSGFRAL